MTMDPAEGPIWRCLFAATRLSASSATFEPACRNPRILRTAWRSRWLFSTRAMRTKPSPCSPNPSPGDTATLALIRSCLANSIEPASRKRSGTGAQANMEASGAGISQPAAAMLFTSTSRRDL